MMAYEVPRPIVEAFYAVYAERDADKIEKFLHGNVEWTISGPVDLLPFCGTHRGKADVIDMIKRQIPQVLRTFSFVAESITVQGDRAAMLSRQSAKHTGDNRVISYRVANFMRFIDGKVIENMSLIDTFDAVEQVLGRPLATTSAAAGDGTLAVL